MREGSQELRARKFSSLRREIIAVIVAVAAVVVTVVVIVANMLRDQTIDNANRELAAVSKVTAERTLQTLSAADILTRSVGDLTLKPGVESDEALRVRATTRAFHAELVGLQKILPQMDAVGIVDSNGHLLANSRQYPAPSLDMSQASFFTVLKANPELGLVISDPVLNPLNDRWMLYLARPLLAEQRRFRGIILAGIQSRYFEEYFSSIDIGPSFSILLANASAKVVAKWPSNPALLGQTLPDLSRNDFPGGAANTRLAIVSTPTGKVLQSATTPLILQDSSLYVRVSMDRAAVLRSWRTSLWWIGAFSGMSLVVLSLLAWLVWRALANEEQWSRALLEREMKLSQQAFELSAARDEAERASRVRGEFLANMSHELRTPLNAILGFSEIMEKQIFGPLGDPRYMEFAGDIHRSGRHLLEVIGNVLDLAKIDAGRLELHEELLDLPDLLRGSARLIEEAARNAGVRLDLRLPSALLTIRADPTRLKQIVLNLLSNAVKFTPADRTVSIGCGIAEEGIRIVVSDQGIGMTPAEAELALQRFRQIDNSLSKKYQGTGLGLPLTDSLVRLHDGKLEIASVSGKGTTVMVTLPRWRLDVGKPEAA